MNKFFIVCLAIMMYLTVHCQDSSHNKFFFNESYLNVNVSLTKENKIHYGFGGGIGLVRVAFRQKQNNIIFGMELNNFHLYSPIYKDNPKETFVNVSSSTYSICFPLFFRHNFCQLKRLYAQLGTTFDLNILSFGTGNYSSYGTNNVSTDVTKVVTLNSRNTITPSASIGYKTKLNTRYFFIRTDYMYSLNPIIKGEMNGIFKGQYFRINIGISGK